MSVKRTIILVGIMVCLGVSIQAGDTTLTFPVNYASFYIPSDSTTYIELYYSLYRNQLGFIASEENDIRYAGVFVSADIFDQDGNQAGSGSTYFLSQAADDVDITESGVRLFDYLRLEIEPGDYRIEVTAIDDVSKAVGRTILAASVPDFNAGALSSSDLQLAYDIHAVPDDRKEAVNDRLVKEERLVIPNPTGVYEKGVDSVIYVYSEIYGLVPSDSENSGFSVRYSVKDGQGNIIHDYGENLLKKPGASAVLANALDIHYFRPGRYFLVLNAADPASGAEIITNREFILAGTAEPETQLTEEDVALMVNIAWYHLSEAEKMQINDLSPTGKANLVRQFWRDQDDDPSNPENPVYDEAVLRYKYANENFSTNRAMDNGWKTDRGRVYITYGPYDEREEEVMTGKTYPYILWEYYQLEGGCIFVFVNDYVAGAVDYRLVHSTHPREKYDPSWQSRLESDESQDSWRDPGDPDY